MMDKNAKQPPLLFLMCYERDEVYTVAAVERWRGGGHDIFSPFEEGRGAKQNSIEKHCSNKTKYDKSASEQWTEPGIHNDVG